MHTASFMRLLATSVEQQPLVSAINIPPVKDIVEIPRNFNTIVWNILK
jgi:hypothetical protein